MNEPTILNEVIPGGAMFNPIRSVSSWKLNGHLRALSSPLHTDRALVLFDTEISGRLACEARELCEKLQI